MFKRLTLRGWRQFDEVDIEFHPRLTVLTGANGSGKTTILHTLSLHLGWSVEFVSTPEQTSSGLRYLSGLLRRILSKPDASEVEIGTLEYDGNRVARVMSPTNVGRHYGIHFKDQQEVPGFYIPSHRPTYKSEQINEIPVTVPTAERIISQYFGHAQRSYRREGGEAPNFSIKKTLVTLAVFGPGNEVLSRNANALELLRGFEEILNHVLPKSLGFNKLSVRPPEVVLVTESGEFSFDAVSGGVAAIIDLAWQMYVFSKTRDKFAVLIDEPENHLHPEMQRTILGNFSRAFPSTQFIVATHNPFIVGSMRESQVYVLRYNEERRVVSMLLDSVDRSGTSNEILREVLGVHSTLPVWVEQDVANILERFRDRGFNAETLIQMKEEFRRLGLEGVFPRAMEDEIDT